VKPVEFDLSELDLSVNPGVTTDAEPPALRTESNEPRRRDSQVLKRSRVVVLRELVIAVIVSLIVLAIVMLFMTGGCQTAF
jgi:hypothetical protein